MRCDLTQDRIAQHIQHSGSDGDCYCFHVGDYRLSQDKGELTKTIEWLKKNKPDFKNYLEIGSAGCGMPRIICDFFEPENISIIDLGDHQAHGARFLQNFEEIKNSCDARSFIGDSHSEGADAFLNDRGIKYDLVLIDGDHTYDGVYQDLDLVLAYLNDDAIVMFHDSKGSPGVSRLMDEMRAGLGTKVDLGLQQEIWNGLRYKKHPRPGMAVFKNLKCTEAPSSCI